MKDATVFKFHIWFKNSDGTIDHDFLQTRFVVATTEEEAESKMEAYRKQMINDGFADFVYTYMSVELDHVIL